MSVPFRSTPLLGPIRLHGSDAALSALACAINAPDVCHLENVVEVRQQNISVWLPGQIADCCCSTAAGPSRALYLPRGLLDPQDIPSYLNGSLAGE